MTKNTTNQIINLSAENIALLKTYRTETVAHYSDIQQAKDELKLIIEAASDKTGVPKNVISKYFKLCYDAKTQEFLEQAAVIESLNS